MTETTGFILYIIIGFILSVICGSVYLYYEYNNNKRDDYIASQIVPLVVLGILFGTFLYPILLFIILIFVFGELLNWIIKTIYYKLHPDQYKINKNWEGK